MNKPRIVIVGPGVVGQATGKAFISKGIDVTYIGREDAVKKLRKEGYSAFTREELNSNNYDYDITMFTVPTPTMRGKINLDALELASIDLGKRLKGTKNYHVVVVKSTVPPGTTENLVIKTVEEYSGKKVGKDFGVCMNPEYLREVSAYEDTVNAWLITIGEYDKKSGDILRSVYEGFEAPIYNTTIKEAELQKYVHNLYNAAKITFFNEMREIALAIGADSEKIFKLTTISCEGMWNPKYGTKDFGAYSGACLPKDTQALYHWARTRGFDVDLLGTVISTNEQIKEKNLIRKYTRLAAEKNNRETVRVEKLSNGQSNGNGNSHGTKEPHTKTQYADLPLEL